MKVEISQRDGLHVASVSGSTMGSDDKAWAQTINDVLDKPSAKLVLDMTGVSYLGSAGLGDLVRINAQANSMGGRMILAALTPFVAGVLATTHLDKFFEIASTVDDAAALLRK
jgi:anti-anti-sigma factor